MSDRSWCVGVVAPFSTGESVVAGPLLAAVVGVVASSKRPVQVIARDDRREPETAAAAVADMVSQPGCLGIVGPKNSGSALAAVPVASAAGVPLVLPCATADELTTDGGVVFRLCAPDRMTAAAAVQLAVELEVERLAVIADDTAYGQRLAAAVCRAAAAAGIESTADTPGTGGAFLAMGEVEQAGVMRSLRAEGYRGELISAEGGHDAPIARLAGSAAEGAWLLYPGAPVKGRSVYAAEAADAARLLLAAGEDGVAGIRSADLDGETGRIRFSADGERIDVTVSRYRIRNGAVEFVS